jgi:PAS domain S-box-containing protein
VLFLFFTAAFGFLFYFLYDDRADFEHEKVQHNLDILDAGFQSILLGNEKFFLTAVRDFPEASPLKQKCLSYPSIHSEVVSIQRSKDDGTIQWTIPQDSSGEMLAQAAVGSPLFSYADSSHSVFYTKPFRFNERYYFEARFLVPQQGRLPDTCIVFYSAEKLLREVLLHHPMENYEVTVFSGWGQEIASTGYSNAPSSIRLQQGVPGYGQLLSVDITEPGYVFWVPEMIFMGVLCGLLSIAVFAITIILQRDVAKLRTTQSSLRSSEERFRAIFENSADAMRLVDRFGRTVMVNSAYCDLTKTSREELLREYNEGDDNLEERYAANSAYRTQFDAGTLKAPASQVIKRRGGEEIPVEARHSFINIGRGEKLLLSIFRDVSERKKYEVEAQQVQRMDALGAFAVGIGNNLKNIFGIVMNSAEMMYKETFGNAQMEQYVSMIIRESKRASELADDLLVFARSKTTEQKPILVEKLIHQTQKILQHSLPPSITVSVTMNDGGAVVNGDIHQLHQAIVNLALTAQRRMPDGGTIVLKTAIAAPDAVKDRIHFSEGKEFLVISVSDNGKELDEYSQRRIFEPFFNARATDQSAGLRLSVAYGIVQHHGGVIDVQSEQGKGTTISLYLPVLYHQSPHEAQKSAETIQGGSECILIVDDEDSFRQLFQHGLVSFGYTVFTAQDGEEALAVYTLHQKEIDLVVSDLSMPKMNGDELIMKLLALNPAVKAILATGAIDLKGKTEFLHIGVRDILMKPFLLDELMSSVRKVLDAR